ncbi:MAG: GNAT family N-acetyltransferase [Alphaproteobacteria bacterium]|nr:GNAT family N-acetyltransferase [Alphaproteobacteria bacterium]
MTFALRTKRLLLRDWRDDDLEPFAALARDPEVMRHLRPLDRAGSDALVSRIRGHCAEHGFGLWAVEIPGHAAFIGFVGLVHVPQEMPFAPAIEIGWRLASAHWRRGYATEAATAARNAGFEQFGFPEIVAYTRPANVRSERVMQRLGMHHDPADDFDHPLIPVGDPLSRHVLYRKRRP